MMAPRCPRVLPPPPPPLLVLVVLFATLITTGVSGSECHDECYSSLVIEENNDFNIRCNESCKVEKCLEGCDLWTEALHGSCQDLCNGTVEKDLPIMALYCMMGCHFALNVYVKNIKDGLGTPAPPFLVASSQTNSSVRIAWKGNSSLPNVSYLVQWKYESLSGDWEYYLPESPLRKTECLIANLHPYTKYKFRTAWIILPQHDPLVSEESVVISTLPYGVPTTAPTISVSAIDPTRILVSWDPPAFSNGPILSYAVSLRDISTGHILVKDISNQNAERFYLFNNLRPATAYHVSVLARNYMGEGPTGSANRTTPTNVKVQKSDGIPYLVLGARQNVIKQGIDMFDESVVLYHSENSSVMIRGVALHYHLKQMFVSDSSGCVHAVPLEENAVAATILRPSPQTENPGLLSVDWLNDKLYLVDNLKIIRCDFDGRNYETVVTALPTSPTDMKVDPYNGYLYWVLRTPARGELYKVDLADLGSEPLTLPDAKRIFSEDYLTAFAADYASLQLLLPMETKNTVVATSLDGLEVTDIRQNTQQPQFRGVKSFVAHHGLLFWTTGEEVIGEEYQLTDQKYFHNSYSVLTANKPFVGLNVLHPDAQPYPVPLNPVRQVEAVFDHDKAKISWSHPKLLRGLGLGAWQRWRYEMRVFDGLNNAVAHATNISSESHVVHSLRDNTTYYVKVRAYSQGGKGTWSEEFRGRTLQKGSDDGYPFLLWSTKEGIFKSNMIVSAVEPFIHRRAFHKAIVIDFAWYNDLLFMNTNSSHIYTFNMTSRQPASRLESIGSAHSLAVDWFARKLYWSNPYQQVISRANFDGSQQEPLPIPTVARELNVDSIGAYLYWTTVYSVECSRLHGLDRQVYFQAGFFAVLGLTVDHDHKKVYWMVRSQEGSQLYRATMAGHAVGNLKATVQEVAIIQEDVVRGPLRYYSNRLFWLFNHREALITDMGGRNTAGLLGPGLSNLKTLTVVDHRQHQFPAGLSQETLNVRPEQVSKSSVAIQGTWTHFNLTWQAIGRVNYGQVFYEIKVDSEFDKKTAVTSNNYYVYQNAQHLPPYTKMTVALRAFTYWSSSQSVIKTLHSPMAVPTAPGHLRIFISHEKSNVNAAQLPIVAMELRWSAPTRANGVTLGYQVLCWRGDLQSRGLDCNTTLLEPRKLVYTQRGLHPNATYYFQVKAFNEAGSGPGSRILQTKTAEETPVPRLLLAKSSAFEVADMDAHEELLVTMDVTEPLDIAYLSQDDAIFWIDSKSGIMRSNMNGSNKTQLFPLTSLGSSITVDWIGRFLYWSEISAKLQSSRIWKMDLNYDSEPQKILERNGKIRTLRVSPFSSALLWTLQLDDNPGVLMTSKTDGSESRLLFDSATTFSYRRRKREPYEECNCPREVDVGQALTLDVQNSVTPHVLWVDELSGHIWSADITGCRCYLVLNASLVSNNGLPPTSITADKTRIYWSNASLHSIYSLERSAHLRSNLDGAPFNTEIVDGVNIITAIGNSLQPFPDFRCLVPNQYRAPPVLLGRMSSSLTLKLTPAQFPPDCRNISRPSTYYVIYYRLATENDSLNCSMDTDGCQIFKSHDSEITLTGLLPYRQYGIQAAVGNFYSLEHSPPTAEVFFMTREGAPSEPQNVSVNVVTPEKVLVTWSQPLRLNGPVVHYYMHWEMLKPLSGHQRQGEQLVQPSGKHLDEMHALLDGLIPSQTYYVAVRAYSARLDSYSESVRLTATTFPEPGVLRLEDATSSQLMLSWKLPDNHTMTNESLFCKSAYSAGFNTEAHQTGRNATVHLFTLSNLRHKTLYQCHVQVGYCSYSEYCNYTWPRDDRFLYETLGDRPSSPGIPYVTHLRQDAYSISWTPSEEHGGSAPYYTLQTRPQSAGSDDADWTTVYNGSEWKWTVSGLNLRHEYVFQVQASNEYGGSNFTASGSPFAFIFPDPNDDDTEIILSAAVSVITVLVLITLAVLYRVCKQRQKDKLMIQDVVQSGAHGDLELATLQELPQNGNFVHQTNILYAIGNHLAELELGMLPHISRDQIVLTKFLGSGAFGEVFEGFARDLRWPDGDDRKVAIKTLRKGATDQEKAEFLKEAQLMSNFKHEHILHLLGVCLDNDPNFIILELMEGGDLLSYLRSNRPTSFDSSSLTVQDLISICVDVARGCKYLEEMHFVHRDLAARNCLVSSHNPALRVVKIGDFGLARDIYKNDYYRKEGEGLLPVRWMSPESLVDGVFTTQSDVWAFGVLLWEIMTLGQQPYPARTNLEVLHYVRGGGRLDKPDNCPDDLHQLMLLCWSYNQDDRPTFTFCLDRLQELKRKSADMPNCVHNHNYVGRTPAGLLERSWVNEFKDRVLLSSNDDVTSTSSDPPRAAGGQDLAPAVRRSSSWDTRQPRPAHQHGLRNQEYGAHKYLELLPDEGESLSSSCDGYEIPILLGGRRGRGSRAGNSARDSGRSNSLSCGDRSVATPTPCVATEAENSITDESKVLALSQKADPASSECECRCRELDDNDDSRNEDGYGCCEAALLKKYANVDGGGSSWASRDEGIGDCTLERNKDFAAVPRISVSVDGSSPQASWC